MRISVAIHLGLLVLALIPLISVGTISPEGEVMIIPVDFRAPQGQPDKGLRARALEQAPVVRPVSAEERNAEKPVKAEKSLQEPEAVPEQQIEEEITAEAEEEVVASPEKENALEHTQSADPGGAQDAPSEGDVQGGDTAGDDAWKAGLDGDGILTRRIVHREDITQVAEQDGVIAINVCVNRGGKVSAAKYNEDHTTIRDKELIRRALYVVTGYRFETDMAAPEKECGMLTFIFDVDVDRGEGKMATID